MTVLDNILDALDLVLETLDQLWEIGLFFSERLVNSTNYINTSPEVVLIVGVLLLAVALRL